MTGCDKFNELISAAIDGEVTPDEEKELICHMEVCIECRSLFSSLRVLSNEFSDMLIEPPDTLVSEIMERIKKRADKREKRKFMTIFGRFAVAAAVIVLVLFAADVFKPLGQDAADMQSNPTGAMTMAETVGGAVPEQPDTSLRYDEAYMSEGKEIEEYTGLLESEDDRSDTGGDTGQVNDGYAEGGGDISADDILAANGPDPETSPEPTTAPAPQPPAVMYELNTKAREIWAVNSYGNSGYYCLSIISGTMPEQLEDCELMAQNGGEMHYLVPRDSIEQINEENRFSEIFYDDLDAEYGIVVVNIPMA